MSPRAGPPHGARPDPDRPVTADPLPRLRALCLALPAAHEVEAWGEPSGWVGVWLDRRVRWKELAGLVENSYQLVAPKRRRAAPAVHAKQALKTVKPRKSPSKRSAR